MKLSDITPYEGNAKKHPKLQVDQIARSIQEFGFNQPIVIDKNNVIVVGHGRYFAAKVLELEDVPVVKLAHLTEEQIDAYRLADNKLNESEWDMELVIAELQELDRKNYDISITGFDSDLLLSLNAKDDVIPENPPAVAKVGDIWELGAHRVLCGDSTDVEAVSTLMQGSKADMVFTDPPYNVAYTGKTKEKLTISNDAMSREAFEVFCEKFIKNLLSFCNGCIYVCMSSSEWGTVQNKFIQLGGHWSRVIIWVKDRMVISRADYHTQFEPLVVVNEDVNEEGEPILYGWKKGTRHFFKGGRKQTDIWRIDRPTASREHPTMKPVQLVTRAITNNTAHAGLVMDLFLGSGSTLIAAEKTGRVCYGMELDPHYVDVIIKRWEDYTGKKAVKKVLQ